MMTLTLHEIKHILLPQNVQLRVHHSFDSSTVSHKKYITDIFIDSRLVTPQSIFICIKGDTFDGHDFAMQAEKQGACAVISEKELPKLSIPVLKVTSTRKALGEIAHAYRLKFNIPVIGITGSCGKTSTKALTASVLSQSGNTLAPEASLNNDLGVPLTLLRLTPDTKFAVIEMGANHPGEIDYLCKIASPTATLITNAGAVHLEGFGSLDGVRKAKGEIYQNLPHDGIAILNRDDEAFSFWQSLLRQQRQITFGLNVEANVRATDIKLNDAVQPQFMLHINTQSINVQLPMIGEHQVTNALAAAAVGFSQNLSLAQIKQGLETSPLVAQRGILQTGFHGVQLIDDSYNANPNAFSAAINMLMALPQIKKRVLVVGDMGELGADKEYWHAYVGHTAKAAGVDALYSVGQLSAATSNAFGENAYHFADQKLLTEALKAIAEPNVCFLIKGSKSSHMNNVVQALQTE